VRYGRRIPSTGPTGAALLAVYAGMFTYGFYQIGQGNKARRATKEEKITARSVIVPFLQADEDRRYVKAWREKVANEAAIMSNVEGWDAESKRKSASGSWFPPGATTRPKML